MTPLSVDQFLKHGCGRCELGDTPKCKAIRWRNEIEALREIVSKSLLTEEVKWSNPCYTYNAKNVLTVSALKDAAVVSFFRGSELSDTEGLLSQPGENSRFARTLKFTDLPSIKSNESAIIEFINQAIKLVEKGEKPQPSSSNECEAPQELTVILTDDADYQLAFNSLTPGRQRGYLLHFNSAKQSKTKTNRILKAKDKIMRGLGWNEYEKR
jgi:uncharacterized protein YdeI (YjbR/CyaY-like superfamily)